MGGLVPSFKIVNKYGDWLKQSQVQKLWIHGEPGAVKSESVRTFCRIWPNQTELTAKGVPLIQEDSPDETARMR